MLDNKFINLIPITYSNIVRITFKYGVDITVYTEGLADNEEVEVDVIGTIDMPAELYNEFDGDTKWLYDYIDVNWSNYLDVPNAKHYYIQEIIEEIYFDQFGKTFLIEQNPYPSEN
jgi:hypothetical protein